MAASSSRSSSNNPKKSFMYDVFISFRGEDTRKSFVDHLYYALQRQGIHAYQDDQRLAKGNRIRDELMKSIEESRLYIIVFSKNYASSSWCLDELVKIMEECQKTTDRRAYPVYYDVDPTEVRNQTGVVGQAFSNLEKQDDAAKWRKTLKEAAYLTGWVLTLDGHEAKFIQMIVRKISLDLCYFSLSNDETLIGMERRMHDLESSLEMGMDDVRMIGIVGIGGSGKTTLARAVFDQISIQFEAKCFVENVREVSKASLSGLNSLQKQVLADVLKDQWITVSSVHDGINMMKRRLRSKKVLLVLDDVDHISQLDALAGDNSWFKPGSRIIITTRDEQVLLSHGVSLIRNVNLLSDEEAMCLFSRYAFGKEIPVEGYEEESLEVVRYAAGLPLTVKVLGSSLYGKDKHEWIDTLARLKTIPLEDTVEKLELSYESLEEDQKQIFLDVACLLKNWKTEDAIRMLDACGFHAHFGLRILKFKSLITIEEVRETEYDYNSSRYESRHYNRICMHDHIEEMGKNIVRRLHPDDPCRHSRLWVQDEIKHVLACDIGTKETRCIRMELTPDIDLTGLLKMKKLQCLIVNYDTPSSIYFDYVRDGHKVCKYLPNALRYLYWRRYPYSFLPKISGENNLIALEIYKSKIEQLWKRGNDMKKLKYLVLNDCENLKGLPRSISSLQCLKVLRLESSGIEELPGDFGRLKYLEELSLKFCKRLKHLPDSICKLTRLKKLDLMFCKKLRKLPEELGDLKFLQELNIENTSISQLPRNISLIEGLEFKISKQWKLEKKGDEIEYDVPSDESPCVDVSSDADDELVLIDVNGLKIHQINKYVPKALPKTFLSFQLGILVVLHLASSRIVWLWEGGERKVLNSLRFLDLNHSKLRTFDLRVASNLKQLHLGGCHDLVELYLPVEVLKLKFLDLSDTKLRTLDLGLAPNLEMLHLVECHDLVELHLPVKIPHLRFLVLTDSKLRTLDLGLALNLVKLHLDGCHDLVELHLPVEILHLRFLILTDLTLRTLDLRLAPNLALLELKECRDLVELNMPKESSNLRSLKVSNLKLETFNLGLVPNLEKLNLEECHNLVKLYMPCGCPELLSLKLSHSKLGILDLGLTPNLERLNLQDSYHLTELHIPIGCLKRLVFLNLSGCSKINSFSFIKELKSLEFLFLTRLYLKEFPDIFSEQGDSRLLEFHFRYNDIEQLPSSIANLHKLVYLDLHSCRKLTSLPKGICGLQHLRNLQLYGCSVEKLPEDINRLECLEKLDLSFTPIKHLPDSVCMLKHLKTLNLSFCWNLEKLPEHIGGLECLQKLILTECTQVRDIPDSICTLKCLKHLSFLDCILLQNLPEELGFLESLKVLNVEGTRIRYLPQSISSLKNLTIYGPKGIRLRGSSHRKP